MDRVIDSGDAAADSMPSIRRFAELCERLTETNGKLEKRFLIAEYLRSLDPHDAALAALYLAGVPFAATDGRQLNVGGSLLSQLLAEHSGATRQEMRAAYLRHGDLGATAFDLLQQVPQGGSVSSAFTLANLQVAFTAIAAAGKAAAKRDLLSALLGRVTSLETKYLIKIILGDMRTGVKESLVEEAIATAYTVELASVRRAMMLNGSLSEVVILAAQRRLENAQMKLFHPLGFMLASPVATVEEALERFALEQPQEKTDGPEHAIDRAVTRAQMEDKYDGIRAQLHCGDPNQPGRVALFSRSREDMTASFPEIVESFAQVSQPLILDGEILAWDCSSSWSSDQNHTQDSESTEIKPDATFHSGRALPFTSLQPRLGRKHVTAEMRAAIPVVFMAFDLLYAGGELTLQWPLTDRRRALEDLVGREQAQTKVGSRPRSAFSKAQDSLLFEEPVEDSFPRLLLAPSVHLTSAAHVEQAYVDARARGNEGVMLKARTSVYQPGRRGLAWLKLKRELATLDVVVTVAEYGHGKRAGMLSDYTFAVRDGDTLKNVGKAYSGLTDSEINNLTTFFLQHTVEDFGFSRSVEPGIVLEVTFNNVMRSDRHDSGFALRFPRIVRIRNDKPVSEIDTIKRVAEIYHSQNLASG